LIGGALRFLAIARGAIDHAHFRDGADWRPL
jgi:hypothetical protein